MRSQKTAGISVILAAIVIFAAIIAIRGGTMNTEPKPIEIKSIDTDGCKMNYFTFGHGKKTFVMLPGASVVSVMNSADAVAAAYADFTDIYTVYLFDEPNDLYFGMTPEQMAAETAKAMEILGIKNADLFGCSLGGIQAQIIAETKPELVHKLVLASTLCRQDDTTSALAGRWISFAKAHDIVSLNRDFAACVYSEEYYKTYEDVFKSIENVGTDEQMDRFAAMMNACGLMDRYDELADIKCPALVIGAWGDKALGGEASVTIADKLGCEIYMYDGYSHAVYDEAPDYKARLLDFFGD